MGGRVSRRRLVLLASAWLTTIVASPTAWGANLLEVYRVARENDSAFEAARYSLEATRQKIPEARAGLLPTVNVSGNDSRTEASTTFDPGPTVTRDVNTWTWTLQLVQPLIRLQNLFVYQESKRIVEQATAQFEQAKQELILRVAQAYFGVVGAQEGIAVSEAQVKATQEQLAIATQGFQAGTHAVTDVYEARSRFDLATAQLVAAHNELTTKRAELEKITGPVSYPLAKLRPALAIPKPHPDDIEAWTNMAQENNPAIRAQKAALAAAEAGIRRNRAEHLPTLDLTASYGKNYASGSLTTPDDYTTDATLQQAGIQLNIPIFAGGGTNARVTGSIANKRKVRAELETARRQAIAEVRQAYAGIENGLSQIKALESTVDSSQKSVKGNRVGFGVGIRTNIDVLNAEQQLYTAQRDLAKARYDTLFQGLKLKAAAGLLAEPDVTEVSAQLGD